MTFSKVWPVLTAAIAVIAFAACTDQHAVPVAAAKPLQHDITSDAKPWTSERFDADAAKFTFAVFSDLTGGEREHIFEIALAQLALLRPELIMSVGDLIEGGTIEREQLKKEWDSFDVRAGKASAPVFRVGGNHDLTHIVMREVWEQRFGARYYHFVYKNVLFLILDSEDHEKERMQEIYVAREEAVAIALKDGWDAFAETEYVAMPEQRSGTIGHEQSAYMQKAIAANLGVRWTFVFLHKAPWLTENEENFAAIERALSSSPYTVFHGHEHAYLHEERLGRDYIQLGTTGGVQNTGKDLSIDHVTMVTVSETGVDIANLRMSGIFDKSGHIPLGGDSFCFNAAKCAETN